MATWYAVRNYLQANYRHEVIGEDTLKLIFNTSEGRSQLLFVDWSGQSAGTARYACFISPIGRASELDLLQLANAVKDYTVGGLVAIDDMLYLRHCVALENLDDSEIEDALIVLHVADDLEAKFLGSDVS